MVERSRGTARGEPALRDARIRLDEEQDADAAGRERGDACGEVAEHRLLGKAQAVAEQARQDARLAAVRLVCLASKQLLPC